MFHLVYFSYCRPILLRSALLFLTLEDYVNSLPVPLGGLLYEVYDQYGRCFGRVERLHPTSLCKILKSSLYETKNPRIIHFAQKAPCLDAYTRYLLDGCYPQSIDSDFVCFNSEDFNKD